MSPTHSKILASAGSYPFDGYDSILEVPDGDNPLQNAWLTIQLRVRLNFVDSKNLGSNIVQQGSNVFARDMDGYLFPILDWPPHLVARFRDEFLKAAMQTWNYQFLLITPQTYSDIDYTSAVGSGWIVRPNVLCLFRLALFGPSGPLDSSPSAGPMVAGAPHRTIDVANLAVPLRPGSRDPAVTANPALPSTRSDFRQSDRSYSDQILFAPAWSDRKQKVMRNTIGHEIGHAIGQSHIMGLKGISQYKIGAANSNSPPAYGPPDSADAWNVMGSGDRLYLINAISWQERIALHTGVGAASWKATGMMNTPPRKIPSVMSIVGPIPDF